jgi:hypothetical protein
MQTYLYFERAGEQQLWNSRAFQEDSEPFIGIFAGCPCAGGICEEQMVSHKVSLCL